MTKDLPEEEKPYILAREEDDIIHVEMGGVINSETLPQSREMVDTIIEAHEIYKRRGLKILVDYKKVVDIDSATIANILERLKEHKKYNHKLAFINISKKFKDLIVLHKLEGTIQFFKTEKEAIKELKKSTQ